MNSTVNYLRNSVLSPNYNKPEEAEEKIQQSKSKKRSENETNERTNGVSNHSPSLPPVMERLSKTRHRTTKRDSFELYIDQIEELDRLDDKHKDDTGKRINKSSIIRDALDYWLGLPKK